MLKNERSIMYAAVLVLFVAGYGCLFAVVRKTYRKAGAFAYFGSDTDSSFQTFDNSLANTQSQTCPLRKVIDLIEPLEDMADTFFRNADSRIF